MKKIIVAAFAALLAIYAGPVCAENASTTGTSTSGTTTGSNLNDDEVVVTVTKNAIPASKSGCAYSKINGDEISRTQTRDLEQAINSTPGVMESGLGGLGSPAYVRMRGTGPNYSLVLVDGVRVNTGINQDANPFLSYAGAGSLENIEIVRGPQSTLYGSESIGGVISLETKQGAGKPEVDLFSEAGSFSTFREGINSSGQIGKLSYFASYERDDSQNNRPNNDISIDRYALRLDCQALENLSLRLTFRGLAGDYQQPGSIFTKWGVYTVYDNNNPSCSTTGESNLLSLVVDWKVTKQWTQKLTLGTYFERYTLNDPAYSGNFSDASNTVDNAANYSFDWQNIVQIAHNNRATAGLAFTEFTGDFYNYDTYFGTTAFNNKSASDWALYFEDEWEPVKNLSLTGGLRYDHYQQAGDALTYRFTGAYLFDQTNTKLRASYGTGFRAPSLLFLYSPNPMYGGNQNLSPETSRGWDIGVDQYLMDCRVVLGATYFHNDIHDLITVVTTNPATYTGQYENVNSAKSQGVELSAQAALCGEWKSRISYTWTDTTVLSDVPQPRHLLSLDTSCLFFSKWLVGGGVCCSIASTQKYFYSQGPAELPNYATLRIYTRYDFNDHFAVFARGENLTNTRYQTTLGFPALPVGAYGGVEIKF